jgi:serine/threonine protein kinase
LAWGHKATIARTTDLPKMWLARRGGIRSAGLSDFPQKLGSYVLLGPLGEGGMGAVYLAMSGHQEMETLCVVKRLRPELRSQPEHVHRFRLEADLTRRLVHGNLAHTHNIGEVEGEVFLVQEFVEGHDVSALLDELARRHRRLPVAVAVHIAGEIARALAYAHAFENLALVHRDINPPNIRLTYAGEVKLLDFGIASSNLHGDLLALHQGAGKLWHLAPEQVRPGGIVDQRTDLYALGLVLWEMLAQRPVGTVRQAERDDRGPETEGEVLAWIARGEHQAPSAFNPEVPPALDALVAKATHVDPDCRHASADEFRQGLAPFLPAGLSPELLLSSLLKELFSPEAERGERQRLIDTARHLLHGSGIRSSPRRRASDAEGGGAQSRTRSVKRWLPLLAVVGLTGLAGVVALLWPRSPGDRQPREAPARVQPPRQAAVQTAASSVRPVSAPVTTTTAAARAPAATAPAAQPPRTVAMRKPAATGPAAAVPSEPANTPAGIDHLRLARAAFNARDWPRALAEGKNAVAAGSGAEAHALLGSTYFKMGRFVAAEHAYSKAAALDPGNPLLTERLRIAHARVQEQRGGKEN